MRMIYSLLICMLICMLICVLLFVQTTHTIAAERPNVIVILVDDMGWMNLSCQGSRYYKTPNIDRIAKAGMRFTNGYAACAVCSPTRATLQTGRYPARTGVTDWIRGSWQRKGDQKYTKTAPAEYIATPGRELLCPPNPYWLEHDELTIAEILGEAGYQTAHIGKWHLGDEDWYPPTQGYQINRGGADYGMPPSYFDPFNRPGSPNERLKAGIKSLPGRKPGQYLTHREAEEAVALIRKWKDKPFFIHMAHYAIHTPIQAIDTVTAQYREPGKTEQNARLAAMVESVDDSTQAILDALDELNLTDNTLVIFTSDNGGLDRQGNPNENSPLRSGKGFPHEGGIRVPFLFHWPGVVSAGKVSDTPICTIDILPTVLEAVGLPLPSDRAIDGLSLLPVLKSNVRKSLGRSELYWHFPHYRSDKRSYQQQTLGPYSIIRSGDWKLIKWYEGPAFELYNLKEDLSETVDLSDWYPNRVKDLDTKLMSHLKSVNAKLPKRAKSPSGKE